MRKAALIFGFVMASAIFSVSSAEATRWIVHNTSGYDVNVAIVYGTTGIYVWEGWFKVPACGGGKVVFDGTLDASLVWFRGESTGGFIYPAKRNNLFCTRRNAFTIRRANDERECRRLGGQMEGFGMQEITTNKTYTLTVTHPRGAGRSCID